MDIEKDAFEDDNELSRLDEEDELVGDGDDVVESEEATLLIVDEEPEEVAPAPKAAPRRAAKKPAKKKAAKKAPKKAKKAAKKSKPKAKKKAAKKPAKKAAKKKAKKRR
jgi:hypothetical protein